jgi:hypothetical protein
LAVETAAEASPGLGGLEGKGNEAPLAGGEEEGSRKPAEAGRGRRDLGRHCLLRLWIGRGVGRAEAVWGAFFDGLAIDGRAVGLCRRESISAVSKPAPQSAVGSESSELASRWSLPAPAR